MIHLACLAVGFLGGFAFGFKIAAMLRCLGPAPQPVDQVLVDHTAIPQEG